MSRGDRFISEDLYRYMMEVSVPEWPVSQRLQAETAKLDRASMQISPDEGNLLGWLVAAIGARRVLEIGTFTGMSSLWMAHALPEDGLLVTCDVSEEWTAVARRYWEEAGLAHKIDLRLGPALETIDQLLADGEAGTFDLAFIDADKGSYDGYYEGALQLVRDGGVIAVDNVLWGGRVIEFSDQEPNTVAIRALNDKLATDERVNVTMLPVADGLTLALKR